MKKTLIGLTLMLLLTNVALSADNPHMGTWKLNESKSKLAAGSTKNHTVTYTASGDSIKVTVDGTDASGKSVHSEWTGKFDGKSYPVTGDPTSDTRMYKKINSRTMTLSAKQGKKITLTGRITLSADGKTRTVTTTSTDAKGKKSSSTVVYDKQ